MGLYFFIILKGLILEGNFNSRRGTILSFFFIIFEKGTVDYYEYGISSKLLYGIPVSVGAGGGFKYDNLWVDKNSPGDGRDNDALVAARRVMIVSSWKTFWL